MFNALKTEDLNDDARLALITDAVRGQVRCTRLQCDVALLGFAGVFIIGFVFDVIASFSYLVVFGLSGLILWYFARIAKREERILSSLFLQQDVNQVRKQLREISKGYA